MAGKKRESEFTWLVDAEIRRLTIRRAVAWAGVADALDCRYPLVTTRKLIGEWERVDEHLKVLQEFAGTARANLSPLILAGIEFVLPSQSGAGAGSEAHKGSRAERLEAVA